MKKRLNKQEQEAINEFLTYEKDYIDIIKVNWIDARTLSGTSSLQDIKDNGLLNAVTIGYLIHETEEYLAIASFLFLDEHHNMDDPITTTAFRDVHYIPKKLIKSILVLKIDFEKSKKYRKVEKQVGGKNV